MAVGFDFGTTNSLISVIARDREHFIIGSKTASTTREEVLQRIDEDLKELESEYLDIYYLRAYNHEMIDAHFAPGGSVEGLLEARRQGKIRYLVVKQQCVMVFHKQGILRFKPYGGYVAGRHEADVPMGWKAKGMEKAN